MTMEDESVRDVVQRLGDPLATVMAAHSEGHVADTRAYLREQTRLARLQSENLLEQNAFEISHLKWRRVGDRVRGVGYIIMILLGLAVVAAAAAAIWSAASDHRLIVESFSVTPGMMDQGQTGTVVAQHVLDRIVAMEADTQSLRAANSYRNNWGDDLKVQIPDTGVSLGEAYHFLVGWLGRQTHITGEVVRDGRGFAVTARAGADAAITVRGDNLDNLLDNVSQQLFGALQPYRYGIYLSSHGREADSKRALLHLAQGDAPASERAWAYSGLLFVEDETRRAEQYGFAAIDLDPELLLAHNNLASVAWRLGHSEFAYLEAATGLKLLEGGGPVELDRRVLGNMRSVLAESVDGSLGDFHSGVREMQADLAVDQASVRRRSQAYLIYDLAQMHDVGAARRVAFDPLSQASRTQANRQTILEVLAKALLDIETRNWDLANTELSGGIAALGPRYASYQLQAPLAFVLAKRGDVSAARALAAGLPSDCYPCVIARARVDVVAGDMRQAASSFTQATRLGPSLPFAWAGWGEMLLRKGDYDAAAEKFAIANQKGPHFADALEMWGEALMQVNRSDLAVAKFEEANKYAPSWGRLHLEWGKALFYAGKMDEARKQFAAAALLDLSDSDSANLNKWSRSHG